MLEMAQCKGAEIFEWVVELMVGLGFGQGEECLLLAEVGLCSSSQVGSSAGCFSQFLLEFQEFLFLPSVLAFLRHISATALELYRI